MDACDTLDDSRAGRAYCRAAALASDIAELSQLTQLRRAAGLKLVLSQTNFLMVVVCKNTGVAVSGA